MNYDAAKVAEVVLALMYLGRHGSGAGVRAWKGYDWEALDRLFEMGMISDPKSKAKSVILTEEGLLRSEELFRRYFGVEGGAERVGPSG